jgi:hypothetical protein
VTCMTSESPIPVEIRKITDPDGNSRIGAVTYLSEVLSTPDVQKRLKNIENQYAILLRACNQLLVQIQSPKGRADVTLHWKIADSIDNFLKTSPKLSGVVVVNITEALDRDIGVSETQLRYLQRFHRAYPNLADVSPGINWSKYRELMDFPNQKSRKECEALIKKGKIKTDTEIREFKRRLKTNRIS